MFRVARSLIQSLERSDLFVSSQTSGSCIPPADSPSDRPRRILPFVRGQNTILASQGLRFSCDASFLRVFRFCILRLTDGSPWHGIKTFLIKPVSRFGQKRCATLKWSGHFEFM